MVVTCGVGRNADETPKLLYVSPGQGSSGRDTSPRSVAAYTHHPSFRAQLEALSSEQEARGLQPFFIYALRPH